MKQRLAADVTRRLAADGFTGARVALAWEADLRHEGQATELTVHYDGDDLGEMAARFVAEYVKTYGYQDESPIELVKLRVVGRGLRERRLDFKQLAIESRAGAPTTRSRAIHFARGAAAVDTEIVPRSALSSSPRRGPLVIEEFDSTTVVPPDASVHRDAMGNIVLDLEVRTMKIDPITFAVIKSGLDSIADDMAYTVVRIARSEIVKDVMDFSAALCAADGQMVAQAKTIAQHLGAIPEAMAAVLAKFGDDLDDGDAVIMNDPYHGGMHLPDIFMFMPLFFDGKRRAFAVVICHHTDVGGRVPGSNASDSTEIYQEGLRIPPLKLYDRGVLNETLETLIKINVRVPDRVWGDLSAQYAAAQVGKRGLEKLLERYGADEVEAYMGELLDYAERLTRAEIKTWPKGRYEFTDHIDNDGFSDDADPHQGRHHRARRRHAAGRLHGLQPPGERRAQLHAQLHALAHLPERALRAAEGRAEQRRRVPLHRGQGAGGLRAQSGDAGAVRGPRAHRLSRVRHHAGRARADRAGARAGGRRGRQQRHLHQRAEAQPQALHHRRHDLRRLGRAAGQGRAGGRHQRLAEPLQHAGRGDGGRASRAGGGIRLRARHLRRRQVARRRRPAALLPHPGARGAAAAAHRPRGVRSPTGCRAESRAAARATSSRSATAASRCRAR